MQTLAEKRILLGVSGGIAIYKSLSLLSLLNKAGAITEVIMTDGAMEFVSPLTFQTMSKKKVHYDLFSEEDDFIPHIDLTRRNDIFLIAPATANVIAKLAHGISDDLLTSTALAATCPIVLAPAMNVYMYENKATQENLEILRKRGIEVLEPNAGLLACDEVGAGRMPEAEELCDYLDSFFTKKDLVNKKILVSCGSTKERMDPVRYMTNDSSGKQGLALAIRAKKRGADVTLIHGRIQVDIPKNIPSIQIESTKDLLEACQREFPKHDCLIMAAAPADYRVAHPSQEKIKKNREGKLLVEFLENPDILATIGQNKGARTLIGFAAETENGIENAKKKLVKKNLDYIVLNDIKKPGAGFDVDTNIVTIINQEQERSLPLMSKSQVADTILDLLV